MRPPSKLSPPPSSPGRCRDTGRDRLGRTPGRYRVDHFSVFGPVVDGLNAQLEVLQPEGEWILGCRRVALRPGAAIVDSRTDVHGRLAQRGEERTTWQPTGQSLATAPAVMSAIWESRCATAPAPRGRRAWDTGAIRTPPPGSPQTRTTTQCGRGSIAPDSEHVPDVEDKAIDSDVGEVFIEGKIWMMLIGYGHRPPSSSCDPHRKRPGRR